MAMTLEQGVAACKTQGLGMSDCLQFLLKNQACGGNPVGAHFPDQTTVQFYCGEIPTTAEAATELQVSLANAKTAQAQALAAVEDAPWWVWLALVGGGGLLVYHVCSR